MDERGSALTSWLQWNGFVAMLSIPSCSVTVTRQTGRRKGHLGLEQLHVCLVARAVDA